MSKFISTTFGYISGRHGTAVASVTKDGKNILRVYKAPSNPNTPKQQAQRQKFGLVNKGMAPLREIVKLGYNNSDGFRKAVSAALKEAVTGVAPDLKLDYSKVKIADGSLQTVEKASIHVTESTSVTVTWDTTLGFQSQGGAGNDTVTVVFFNEATGLCIPYINVVTREEGTASISLPEIWHDASLHCWLYLTSEDGRFRSPGIYIQELQL